MTLPIQTRECCACHKVLPFSEFWKDSQRKSGIIYMCKPCGRLKQKTKANKMLAFNRHKLWVKNNELKVRAYQVVSTLKKSGVIKQEPCFFCGNVDSESHHILYEYPEKVIWICPQHHKDIHRNLVVERTKSNE